jgi:chromosome partitioning protein
MLILQQEVRILYIMIILVGGEKRGSGKSCLAQNLAVYFARNKKAIVLMVDCDPQKTTSDWIQQETLTLH